MTPLCAAQSGSSRPRHTRGRHRANQGRDEQSVACPAETTDVLRQFSAARPPHAVATAYPRLKKLPYPSCNPSNTCSERQNGAVRPPAEMSQTIIDGIVLVGLNEVADGVCLPKLFTYCIRGHVLRADRRDVGWVEVWRKWKIIESNMTWYLTRSQNAILDHLFFENEVQWKEVSRGYPPLLEEVPSPYEACAKRRLLAWLPCMVNSIAYSQYFNP